MISYLSLILFGNIITMIICFIGYIQTGIAQEANEDLLKAVREMIPDIESETKYSQGPGQPVARLVSRVNYDVVKTKIKKYKDENRRLLRGTILVSGYSENTKTGQVRATFQYLDGSVVGSIAFEKRGKLVVVDVFPPSVSIVLQEMPVRRVIPRPEMWVVPLVK